MSEPLKLLKQYFGYSHFRPPQEEIISAVLDQRDVMVLMPTGGGKSVCYQIPALMKEGMALVISPLISLMKDQVEALTANGIAAGFINSSMTSAEEQDMVRRCQDGQLKLLYISPEKAMAVANSLLRSLPLSLIAIDEAHCISQWGHDFRPEYTQLKNLRTIFKNVPMIALTATADKVTRRDMVNQLELKDPEIFVSSFDRPNFHLSVRSQVQRKQKDEEILAFIQDQPDQCGIVYCLSRKGTEELCGFLRDRGVQADYYHAGMNAEERSRVQEDFIYDRSRVICATIAFGMGIDKSNVRWIIHYNLPKNMEGYYQEIGRAGRDGAPAKTILYYNISDLMMLNRFAADSGQPELNVEKLKRMQQYAEARVCRRKILLGYFGENYDRYCMSCDVCDDPPKYTDGTLIAQKAISALLRANESIGIHMLVDILRGSMNAELVAAGYDKLKTHGAGREYSRQAWQSYILQLLQLGVFEMAYDEGFSLKVSDYGKQLVRGMGTVELAGEQEKARKDYSKASGAKASKEEGLFGELRLLRRQIAEQEGLPPYVIFHDSSLLEMADQWPVSRQEMLAISGMSYSKYIKYGHYFENRIRELAKDRKLPERLDPETHLSEEKIRSYVEELKQYDVRISHALIGKLLLGSEGDSVSGELKELSFYGVLAGKTNYKMIGPILQQRYKNLGIPAARPVEMRALQYFDGPAKNELSVDERNSAIQVVRSFERNRPDETVDNAYILDARKTYPRAYDFWSEEENELLLELSQKTNDLDTLASIFQRNPSSIKSQFKKLAKP